MIQPFEHNNATIQYRLALYTVYTYTCTRNPMRSRADNSAILFNPWPFGFCYSIQYWWYYVHEAAGFDREEKRFSYSRKHAAITSVWNGMHGVLQPSSWLQNRFFSCNSIQTMGRDIARGKRGSIKIRKKNQKKDLASWWKHGRWNFAHEGLGIFFGAVRFKWKADWKGAIWPFMKMLCEYTPEKFLWSEE